MYHALRKVDETIVFENKANLAVFDNQDVPEVGCVVLCCVKELFCDLALPRLCSAVLCGTTLQGYLDQWAQDAVRGVNVERITTQEIVKILRTQRIADMLYER